MKIAVKWFVGLAGISILSGCAGGEDEALRNKIDARVSGLQVLATTVDATGPTLLMPTTGTARYNGYGALNVETAPNKTVMIGIAQVDADFASSTLSGSVGDFVGQDEENVDQRYAGSVTLANGAITGNEFVMDYSGTLRGSGETIVADGVLDGGFTGSNADQLAAVAQDDTMLVNGSPTLGTFILLGER